MIIDDQVALLLFRRGDRVSAIDDRCSHRGCPLHEGKVSGTVIVCPCHGSAFSLDDGSVLHGPAKLGGAGEGETERVRFVCLHGGTGKGALFFWLLPD